MNIDQKKYNLTKRSRPTTLKGVPFAWQDVRITKLIRLNFSGKRVAVAIATYQALTELATSAGRSKREAVSEFPAYLSTIAKRVNKSVSTIKRYLNDFQRMNIVIWQTRKQGYKNYANLYTLCDHHSHNSEPTPIHNNELPAVGHNNELHSKERRKDLNYYKKSVDNQRANNGFRSIKDSIEDRFK